MPKDLILILNIYYNQGIHLIQDLVKKAITEVKNYLKNDSRYDLTEWSIDEMSDKGNVIRGVKKHGMKIVIVIRPTDGDKIIFD